MHSDKLIVALDTTGDTFSVGLRRGQHDLAEYCGGAPRQHLTEFYGVLEGLLRDTSTTLKDVAAVAVTTGPGSFTGVRLGVLIARTLGQALNCPILPVNAMEALARMAFTRAEKVGVLGLDARKNEILGASCVGEQWREPARLMVFSEWVHSIPAGAQVAGNALARYGQQLSVLRPDLELLPPEFSRVRATAVGFLGLAAWEQRLSVAWSRLSPDYMRPADVQVH